MEELIPRFVAVAVGVFCCLKCVVVGVVVGVFCCLRFVVVGVFVGC